LAEKSAEHLEPFSTPMPEIMEEDAKALPEVMAEEPNTEAAAEPAAPQLVDDISEIPQELVQEQPAEPILDVPQSAEESVEIVPADPEDRVTSARSSVQIAPEALAPPVEEVAATWPDAEEKEGSIVEPERVEDTVTAPPIEPPQEQVVEQAVEAADSVTAALPEALDAVAEEQVDTETLPQGAEAVENIAVEKLDSAPVSEATDAAAESSSGAPATVPHAVEEVMEILRTVPQELDQQRTIEQALDIPAPYEQITGITNTEASIGVVQSPPQTASSSPIPEDRELCLKL